LIGAGSQNACLDWAKRGKISREKGGGPAVNVKSGRFPSAEAFAPGASYAGFVQKCVSAARVWQALEEHSAPKADHVNAISQHECVKWPPVFGSSSIFQEPGFIIPDVGPCLLDVPPDRAWLGPGGAVKLEPTRLVPGLI
jgi:hypothetical protein